MAWGFHEWWFGFKSLAIGLARLFFVLRIGSESSSRGAAAQPVAGVAHSNRLTLVKRRVG